MEFKDRLATMLREAKVPERGKGKWLANEIGVSPKAVSKWLNGETKPDDENMKKIADLFGKDIVYVHLGVDVRQTDVMDSAATCIDKGASPVNTIELDDSERKLINTFRQLPESGKFAVLSVLHREKERMND